MTPRVSPQFRFAIRAGAAACTALVVCFVLTRAIVPEGRLTVTTDFSGPAPFLSEPKPSDRIVGAEMGVEPGLHFVRSGSPVYVDLRPPAQFDSVTMTLRYRDAGATIVEMGALASPEGQFDVRAAGATLLDALAWSRIESGSTALYQRNATYRSVDDFLTASPSVEMLAAYRAEPATRYRIKEYAPSATAKTLRVSLRGGHRILAYAKDEPFSFTFVTQDMNRGEGADPVIVTVFRVGSSAPIASATLPDDSNVRDDEQHSSLREMTVTVPHAAEGVYRVEVTTTNDVFIRDIRTTLAKVVFEGRMFFGDYVGYSDTVPPATVFASGSRLEARTPHAEGMQTLKVGAKNLVLDLPNAVGGTALENGLTEITVPRRNVLLETDGVFALSRSAWFNPLPFRIGPSTTMRDLDAAGIDTIFAAYAPPEDDGGIRTATATFDMRTLAKTPTGAYRFSVIAPGVGAEGEGVLLDSATFTLRRDRSGFFDRLLGRVSQDPDALHVLPFGVSYGDAVE